MRTDYEEGDDRYQFSEWLRKKAERVVPPGHIRIRISGKVRRKICSDDSAQILDKHMSIQWHDLCNFLEDEEASEEEVRERVWGYRADDLDESWNELKIARTLRAGWFM